MLVEGMRATNELVVSGKDTALARGSGSLEVFATPALAELMEACACLCLEGALEEGETTVGYELNLHHLAPTPVGMRVQCECELVAIEKRSLTFELHAFDDAGEIGSATHKRAIVNAEKFQAKADEKKVVRKGRGYMPGCS